MSKANSNSTVQHQGSIEEQITAFPFWSEDVNGTLQFWGTHWQCDRCDAISSLGPEDIRHKDDCPNAGTEDNR